MGRFERKLKQLAKKEAEPYETWVAKHAQELGIEEREEVPEGDVLVKRAKIPLSLVAVGCALLLLCAGLLTGLLMKTSVSNFEINENSVKESEVTESDVSKVTEDHPWITKLEQEVLAFTKKVLIADESWVMIGVQGDLSVENYYLIRAYISYNDNYVFLGREVFEDLPQSVEVGTTKISYKFIGFDQYDLYEYWLLSETEGNKIYWKVSCFEDDITEFIDVIFTE